MKIWQRIRNLVPGIAAGAAITSSINAATPAENVSSAEDQAWQATYDARDAYYRKTVGEFPEDILKVPQFSGVWPGGGLFVIRANKLGGNLIAYTTFGLSNPDMPTSVRAENAEINHDELGRVSNYSLRLVPKERVPAPDGAAGYGYELIVLAREDAEWPLWILQWALNAEVGNDVGLLKRVEKYSGLTVQDIQVGKGGDNFVHLLFAKAAAPLPTGTQLPNGRMDIIVATVITKDEMDWSMSNGRDALLAKLIGAGIGQVSDRKRASVLK